MSRVDVHNRLRQRGESGWAKTFYAAGSKAIVLLAPSVHADVKLGDYPSLVCELLADNADPLAPAVYEAIDMPFMPLMHQLAQAWK